MSADFVKLEDVAAVLRDQWERYAALEADVAAAKEVIKADSSPETFKAYFTKHSELGRQELRLFLLKKWAAKYGVELAA